MNRTCIASRQRALVTGAILLAALFGPARTAWGGDPGAGEKIFNRACVACHSIGGGRMEGPDLKDVTKRRDRAWLVRWLKDPVGMVQSDETAKALFEEYNKVQMPPSNLSEAEIADVLAYIEQASAKARETAKREEFVPLSPEEFARGKQIYFNRCAGCHGLLRAGATGPNIQPDRTRKIGVEGIYRILVNGLPGGMPAWGKSGVLTDEEMRLMARYVQMEPPEPPRNTLEQIRATWKLLVPVEQRPKEPMATRDWENYFGVILRDAGKVAILDGDTKELLAVIDTGFAVHILRSSSTGRYFYAVGRDGKVSLIDLWPEKPQLVAQVQGCFDARSVEASKYKGYEDKLVIEGCYWPPQYVVFDGLTLEPLAMVDVVTPAYDTGEPLKEVRVASIIASHFEPVWMVSLKESGHVAIVDYSKPGFPMVAKLAAERFLHDGGWDSTGRYFIVAANMRNKLVVIDAKERKLVTKFETGIKPHPGRGANWLDPEFGPVDATTHIGQAKLAVYGADPKGHPDHAWKVVRSVPTHSTGGLFVKTHPNSDHVWLDSPLSNDPELARSICVYSKKEARILKCWPVTDHGRAVHFEYNKAGTEVWVSGWDKKGTLVIYDDKTLKEVQRIEGDWLVTPTGKFNVYNTAHDVY